MATVTGPQQLKLIRMAEALARAALKASAAKEKAKREGTPLSHLQKPVAAARQRLYDYVGTL